MVRLARHSLSLLSLLVLALPAQAQTLPKAEDLMNDYIAKTGGEKVYKDVKSRISKGSISLAGQKGELVAYQKAPDLMYMVFDLPGLGKFETGTNGKVVWEKNSITGAKLQTGTEKAKMLRSAAFDSDYNWKKYFKTVETEKEETVEGMPAYKVKLTSPEGEVLYRFFDKKSGLIVKMISKVDSQFGEVETESFISDYKKVGGMLVAFKAVQKVAGMDVIIQLNTIEHDVNVPEDRFDLPNDVKQLLKKA